MKTMTRLLLVILVIMGALAAKAALVDHMKGDKKQELHFVRK